MRHIFDQYSQPENRLTHALVSSLSQDPKLLQKFVRWAVGQKFSKKEKLHITEQSYPGQEDVGEHEAEKRGLPDAWIYSDSGWALLIESKVACGVSLDQLKRHAAMARRRGFLKFALLVINIDSRKKRLPKKVFNKTWQEIYQWGVGDAGGSEWAGRFTSYLEIAEAKMAEQEYLKEGTLTKFSGVYFDAERPYTYLEAKRILGLLIDELKKDRSFLKKAGIDPSLPGRGAIKGTKGSYVWDFMRIKESRRSTSFTSHPHITFCISSDSVSAQITIPNGVKRDIRKRLLSGGYESFKDMIYRVLKGMKKTLKIDPSAKPFVRIQQRHYTSQSALPIEDAALTFDLRTIFKKLGRSEKYQPQWLRAAYDVLTEKKSNLQFQIVLKASYESSSVIRTPKIATLLKEAVLACRPFLDRVLDRD